MNSKDRNLKLNIREQGVLADQKLSAAGLVLTQGGEPTFVPHDTRAPEWNIAALGPEKLRYARKLARELAATQFKGGVILQSFGKQYPGEPLPRWQIGIYRSRGGDALWSNLNRLRLDSGEALPSGVPDPQEFIEHLAKALSIPNTAVPVYEDFAAQLQLDESDAASRLLPRFSRKKLAFVSQPLSTIERETWRRFFEPAGWVLPLAYDDDRWVTDEWALADGSDLVLIPGDSPIGLRLPLSQLADDALQRGLTVELKEDSLLIFLPPLATFKVFAELVRTIENIITALELPPVYLEGYTPPGDDDLESIALTSDPGVIEVNLPPASDWLQFERYIDGMYQCAHNVGLRSFKYQLSGRQVGSGGGTHIVIGGPDLARNPFIEKPSLLSSFLRFLQHHPSLSFAFSGLFIGPSSQAPRVDESAYELPYELEITLRAIEEMAEPGSPEEMDALLRNLLMDWNGNTHRAELSVDKFYNYNAPNGQNGLVEFRAFEMMPQATMLLAANALIRALTACFAEKAYTLPLIDWREALHDKYALPYFLEADLAAVMKYLKGHGFSFQKNAFAEQIDFRFPEVTSFDIEGVQWTLRQALEPWPVMGEHEGTGRVVDSTTDRLELRAARGDRDGAAGDYVVAVNGIEMPMIDAADNVRVGAIRYRLFDNPWGLQPQIKAHTPLEIRIIEAASGKIVHAIEYANWTRDKEGYERPPETQQEARRRVEERLSSRDDLIGQKQDLPKKITASPHAPYTLDLRRV